MTFHRVDNKVVYLADGLTHTVLGTDDNNRYLRWCGGYEHATPGPWGVLYPTCFFCLMKVKR